MKKVLILFILVGGVAAALSSCKKDEKTCYECSGNGQAAMTLCLGEDGVNQQTIDAATTAYQLLGGDCVKQ